MEFSFAERMAGLHGSAIREMFKIIAKPEIISFAGGLPAAETFPVQAIIDITAELLSKEPAKYLQYGITAGYKPLIDILTKRLASQGSVHPTDEMMIVTGGQQGIDLAAKAFINKGDAIACEIPSFVGALNSFRTYQAELYGIEIEDDGMNIDKLESAIKQHPNIKMVYVIPTFQNPSGVTMSLEKRKRLLEVCRSKGIMIIEDNPYGELRFEGEDVPTIKSLDKEGKTVIYVGSLSKVLSPGLRTGFVIAHSQIIEKIDILKQVNDVHTNLLTQAVAAKWLEDYDFEEHIVKARELYKHKCGVMLDCMDKTFPDFVSYTRPQGGIFILATINKPGADSAIAVQKCIERKVAFVPGFTFMTDMEKPTNCFRLNYSTMPDERIIEGIDILADTLNKIYA